jgi:hypothetical protein
MFKPVLQLAAVGVVGIFLWKIAAAFLLPFIFLLFKVALIGGLIVLAIWWFNKRDRRGDTPSESPPPVSE